MVIAIAAIMHTELLKSKRSIHVQFREYMKKRYLIKLKYCIIIIPSRTRLYSFSIMSKHYFTMYFYLASAEHLH